MFSDDEIQRYARHIVLAGVGGPGQQKLKRARALVVGAGGLGNPVVQYLAAAGVGTLGIADDDIVSLSDLQRQVIFNSAAVGRLKVDCAAESVQRQNPHVAVERLPLRLTDENIVAVVDRYDIVADCSDNFTTRYVVSDACCRAGKPLVAAAVGQFDGSLTTLKPYLKREDGEPNPTYRCLFPEPPPAGLLPTCAEAGVLGALVGVIGSLQALEVIKEITAVGRGLTGRLVLYDSLETRFETVEYRWDPRNPLTGRENAVPA